MGTKLHDHEWNTLAQKNAKHRAAIHIESGNIKKIAEALKDTPILDALSFLFAQAEKHRRENRFKKASVILEAAQLLDRKTGATTDLTLRIEPEEKGKETTTLSIGKRTPDHIFNSPI